jgi:hypothetical protein
VIPRSVAKGSRTVISCYFCNIEKSHLTLEEFRVLKAFRYGYISGVEFKFPGEENDAIDSVSGISQFEVPEDGAADNCSKEVEIVLDSLFKV